MLSGRHIVIYFEPKSSEMLSTESILSVNILLVSVTVAIELSTDSHVESVNDASILARPKLETTATARWDVR